MTSMSQEKKANNSFKLMVPITYTVNIFVYVALDSSKVQLKVGDSIGS